MGQEEVKDVESRIVEAAKQVFIRKGFEAATMGDIALEAGIGRTSLNYYFRTKEMLFDAILGKLMNMILPNVNQIVESESSYPEKVKKIISLYLQTIRENELIPLFVVNELQRDPQHLFHAVLKDPERIAPILKLQQFVNNEMEKGNIRKMPIVDLVSTFISLVIFPFLIKTPLTTIFLNGNEDEFDAFLDRRVELVYGIIEHLLKPENK
ncbi:TetR/AcrR family transcriptional regulator [Massilibacteroides sp.]|uniref:TetR/AcrR family transcriptional regulator n=1 Tax=Massilibacteroides sp. TaxID=2034766 RepID=UPI00261D0E35|nr:TetR/AcrR family transcriptional regulator [Massilibacteroides sp.]MDD4516072.1 helix-turn-helix domain containing protein [Massilibacteroides sp.]